MGYRVNGLTLEPEKHHLTLLFPFSTIITSLFNTHYTQKSGGGKGEEERSSRVAPPPSSCGARPWGPEEEGGDGKRETERDSAYCEPSYYHHEA